MAEDVYSFGDWVRLRRQSLVLSREDLARQVSVAEISIRKIEADERRPSPQVAALLAQQLQLAAETHALFVQVARGLLAVDQLPPPIPGSTRVAASPTITPSAAPAATPAPLPSGTVTFLFTDIEGSTRLWERHPQAMRVPLARHEALLRKAITAAGGVVFKLVGDAICAAFASAQDAVTAVVAGQRALQAEAWGTIGSLSVRMALHTGVVEEHGGDYLGLPLSRVARLLSAGHGGQILLSLATEQLVREQLPPEVALRDLGSHRLKDLSLPEQIFQILAPDLPSSFAPLQTLDAHRTNLPTQPTSLIGRERELAQVTELLARADVRLVTLTGPGGTGKTHLALQTGAELLDDFAHGVYFVNLAPISDHILVTSAIAQTLGVTEIGDQPLAERLRDYLRDKQLLLVLDNFEQVLDAAPLVAALLAGCPQLTVLVTSRVVLHLRGEREFPVPALALPDLRHLPPLAALSQYAAVALFIERARDVQLDFAVTNKTAPAVAEICHRVDGLPLAIELAAARIKLFSPEALLARLGHRLAVLTGGPRDLPSRQQTIRSTIAWSYDLLDDAEQALFARLGVFVGGWTLEAVEAVASPTVQAFEQPILSLSKGSNVLDGLAALVDKSLVKQTEGLDGAPRFALLETIREYALERLAERGELEDMQRGHAVYFVALAEQAAPGLIGPRQRAWLERLECDFDNLRAVVAWTLRTEDHPASTYPQSQPRTEEDTLLQLSPRITLAPIVLAARLCVALDQFFMVRRSHIMEGIGWLERVVACDDALPTNLRAWAFFVAGDLWDAVRKDERAKRLTTQSLALFRTVGDKRGVAAALSNVGSLDITQASACFEESLALARELGDSNATALALLRLGATARERGDDAREEALLEESLALYRALGHTHGVANGLLCLGKLRFYQGEYAAARALNEERLAIEQKLENVSGIGDALAWLGRIAFAQGDNLLARTLLEESLALSRELGLKVIIAWRLIWAGHMTAIQGDSTRARMLLRESLTLYRELGDQRHVSSAIEGFAALEAAHGRWEHAARLLGAAEAVDGTIGSRPYIDEQPSTEHLVAACRAALGEEAFDAAWAAGQALTIEQAIMDALGSDT